MGPCQAGNAHEVKWRQIGSWPKRLAKLIGTGIRNGNERCGWSLVLINTSKKKINAYYSGNFREHDEINIVIIGHQWCARSDRRLESDSWPSAPWRPAGLRPHSRASSKKQVLLGNILPNSGNLYVYMSIVFYFPAVAVKVTTIPTKNMHLYVKTRMVRTNVWFEPAVPDGPTVEWD